MGRQLFALSRAAWVQLEARIDDAGSLTGLTPTEKAASLESVIRWDTWSEEPLVEAFGRTQTVENWACDIGEVTGLNTSSSPIWNYDTLSEFAERAGRLNCKPGQVNLMDDGSQENVERLVNELKLDEPLRNEAGSKFTRFTRFSWHPDRLYLENGDGSHRFSIARYHAQKRHMKVPLRGALHVNTLEPHAAEALQTRFHLYAVEDNGETPYRSGESDHPYTHLIDALQTCGVKFCTVPAPEPLRHAKIIALPKNRWRSRRAARLFKWANYPDVGAELQTALELQERHTLHPTRF